MRWASVGEPVDPSALQALPPASFCPIGVGFIERVSLDAVSLSCLFGRRRFSAQDINLPCDEFHMGRVNATTIAAEMVYLKMAWNRPTVQHP